MRKICAVITIILIMLNNLLVLAQQPDQLAVLQADVLSVSQKIVTNKTDIDVLEALLRSDTSQLVKLQSQLEKAKAFKFGNSESPLVVAVQGTVKVTTIQTSGVPIPN